MTNNQVVDFALMAGNAYKESRKEKNIIPIPSGWGLIGKREFNPASGFEAAVFKKAMKL